MHHHQLNTSSSNMVHNTSISSSGGGNGLAQVINSNNGVVNRSRQLASNTPYLGLDQLNTSISKQQHKVVGKQ